MPDHAAAEKHIVDEPYVINGIQDRWQISRWKPALTYTWRDCPRKAGHIQALLYEIDHADGLAKRTEIHDTQAAGLNEHRDRIMMHGPLLDDAGEHPVESAF